MLYGIEGILNGKLFGNGEGGSSGGGITLPELTNPAGADQILEGYEAVDGSGNKLTGTHVCESGGGDYGTFVLGFEDEDYIMSSVSVPAKSYIAVGEISLGTEDGEEYVPTGWVSYFGYLTNKPTISVAAWFDGTLWQGVLMNTSSSKVSLSPNSRWTLMITGVVPA